MNNTYARAYTEVLEMLKYFPEEEYAKIPAEKIEFYKNNMDYNYKFSVDIDSYGGNISKEARCILLILFRDYLATERQKNIMQNVLKQNQLEKERKLREKYNPDDIFKNSKKQTKNEISENNVNIVWYKESWIRNIINKIKYIFKK